MFADATGSPQDDAMSTAVARPTIRLKVDCPDSTCTGGQDGGRWSFEGDVEVSIVQLQFHVKHGHERAAPAADIQAKKPCPPPLQLPKLPGQCSEAKFEEFKKLWEFYKNSLVFSVLILSFKGGMGSRRRGDILETKPNRAAHP